MGLDQEIKLGKSAVEKGYITQQQLEEAIELSFTLRKAGSSKGLLDILLKKGTLSYEQANKLYESAGIPVRVCTSCGADVAISDPEASTVCWQCGESVLHLMPPDVQDRLQNVAPPVPVDSPTYLIDVSSPTRKRYPVKDQPVSIGRSKDNTVVVDDLSVSKKHARITPSEDGYVLWDLNSRNGTRVNNEPIHHTILQHGDVIDIGQRFLLFIDERTKPVPVEKGGTNHVFTLTGIRGVSKGNVYLGGREPFLIGRSSFCNLVLPDPQVSDFQTQFSLTSRGVHVFHIGSNLATELNGTPISVTAPRSGDILRLGENMFRILIQQTIEDLETLVTKDEIVEDGPTDVEGKVEQFEEYIPSRAIAPPPGFEGKKGQSHESESGIGDYEDEFAELICTSGPDRGLTIPFTRKPTTIGRAASADIRTSDLTCSREHAMILIGPDGLKIKDLGSRNGTFVNGKRVRAGRLRIGDEVRMGKDVFMVDLAVKG